MEPKIIYEDEPLLVVDKPAGMVVNRAETTVNVETVQDWVLKNFKFQIPALSADRSNFKLKDEDFYSRAGIVHRLDKETSGLLLIAKTPEAFEGLQRQFKERVVKKKYLALVSGLVKPAEGEVNAPVGRLPWDREKFGVFPSGREARTLYKSIDNLTIKNQQYTILQLVPTTGRTHQIRVHLKYLGYPIVSDPLYGGRKAKEERRWCPRVFLHAAYLEFKHPSSGERVILESPLPDDLRNALNTII